jgi:hypothetical protein
MGSQPVALFRSLLREGRKFPNYNIREWVLLMLQHACSQQQLPKDLHLSCQVHPAPCQRGLQKSAGGQQV